MMNKQTLPFFLMTLTVGFQSMSAWAGEDHDHGGDVVVARTAGGQLAVEFDFDEPLPLEPVNGLLVGWALDEPGFLSLDQDEPDEDLFVLGAQANVAFELISADPAIKAWLPGFGGFLEPGETWVLGMSPFDVHPGAFHIDSTDDDFDPEQTTWLVNFRLIDTGTTAYDPTDTLAFTFEPVPEPTTALLLLAGTGFGAMRHRRRGQSGQLKE